MGQLFYCDECYFMVGAITVKLLLISFLVSCVLEIVSEYT